MPESGDDDPPPSTGKMATVQRWAGEYLDPRKLDFIAVLILRVFNIVTLGVLAAILTMGSLKMGQGIGEFFGVRLGLGYPPPVVASPAPKVEAGKPETHKIGTDGGKHDEAKDQTDQTVLWQAWFVCHALKANLHSHVAISTLMGGLEYFLLAPLAYLLLRSLGLYMATMAESVTSTPTKEAIEGLLAVKGLSTGLLIAVLATHLVSKFLAGSHRAETFPWEEIAAGAGFLVVLVIYYKAIHSASE